MSRDWIKADDGELYPIAFDEVNFEKNLIGNYCAEEDLLPQIEFKEDSDCKLAAQEVCFPIISEDERYKNVPNKIILALKNFFSEETGLICGILAAILGLVFSNINFLVNNSYIDINDCKFIGGGIGLIAYILFLVLLNKLCGLKAYDLSKDTEVWTINFKDETVVRVKPVSVSVANKNFKKTVFCCDINGSEYYLNGDDIYFSEEAAMNVLDFVVKSNDSELKRYYPNWKNDSNFVNFYKKNIYEYGFNRDSHDRSPAVFADWIEINEFTYFSKTSIKDLFTKYLSTVNEQKELEKEKQKLIDKINDYQSSIN